MIHPVKTVALISKDPDSTGRLTDALSATPDLTVEARKATLAEVNGGAVDLVNKHDVVIFYSAGNSEEDLAAIRELRAEIGESEPLVAVTSGRTALEDVRRMTQAGVTDVVPDTIAPAELAELLERLSSAKKTAHFSAGTRSGKVIAVAQARGGVGSTTIAVNLADALLDRRGGFRKTPRHSVALVDLDLQMGDVSNFLEVSPSEALYDLAMKGEDPDEQFVVEAMEELPSGLSVLAAPMSFAPLDSLKAHQVAELIAILRRRFDYVVLDLPGNLVEWLDGVLETADQMLLVTDSSVPSIRQSRRLIDFFTETNLALKIDMVINNEAKPLFARRHHTEASKVLDRRFRFWIPYDPRAAREATDRGAPLSAVARRSRMTRGIARLGQAIIKDLEATGPTTATKQQ